MRKGYRPKSAIIVACQNRQSMRAASRIWIDSAVVCYMNGDEAYQGIWGWLRGKWIWAANAEANGIASDSVGPNSLVQWGLQNCAHSSLRRL